jgi:peptidoglycan/LPS O-acetylase OafA/YrhL
MAALARVRRRTRDWACALPVLGDLTGSRARGMDVLRLAAATLVIVAHSYNLTNHAEPLRRFGGPDFGDIAVAVFFAISGFLVTASWISDSRLRSFVMRRALRILPGLWVVLLLTVAVGVIVTTLRLTTYLTSLDTWRYPLERGVVYSTRSSLPGVFTTNPYGAAVNGSLWTLPVEVTAYVATLLLGVTGVLARRRELVVLATVALVAFQETFLPAADSFDASSAGTVLHWLVHFGIFYAAGALLFLYREHIRLSWGLALAGLAVWLLCFNSGVVTVVGQVTLPRARVHRSLDAWPRRPLLRDVHLCVPGAADAHPLLPRHLTAAPDRADDPDHLCLRVLLLAARRAARAGSPAPPDR